MNSAEEALVAQIRAGQEQTNRRLEALLAAIHQLCDLVARLAPVEDDALTSRPPVAAYADRQLRRQPPDLGAANPRRPSTGAP
jgi:hypothetical protein